MMSTPADRAETAFGEAACARPGALSAPVLTRCISERIISMMRAAFQPRYVPLRKDKQRKRARAGACCSSKEDYTCPERRVLPLQRVNLAFSG
jgi:hypothetical protein